MADTLCLMKECGGMRFATFYIERDSYRHSGNWDNLGPVIERGVIQGHEFDVGYYYDRLKGRVKLGPVNILLRWQDD